MTTDGMIAQRRSEKLVSLGYCERVYTDSNYPTDEFKFKDQEKGKYYKLVPLPVTDEQWEKILAIGTIPNSSEGILPKVLKWLGIISFLAAFVAGLIAGNTQGRYDFNASAMFIWWGAGFITSVFEIWMGEVLRSLRKMQNQ